MNYPQMLQQTSYRDIEDLLSRLSQEVVAPALGDNKFRLSCGIFRLHPALRELGKQCAIEHHQAKYGGIPGEAIVFRDRGASWEKILRE